MSVIDKSDVHRWLFGEETISSDSRENVDNEVVERAVPGVLYLCDVLQLVVDGLNDGPLAQQNLVLRTHEHVPHIRYSGARSASNSSLKRSKRCSLTYKK